MPERLKTTKVGGGTAGECPMQKAESLTREQMREFLAASEELPGPPNRDLRSGRAHLRRQRYLALTKKDKGVVRRYLAKLSRMPQITRLIRQYRKAAPCG